MRCVELMSCSIIGMPYISSTMLLYYFIVDLGINVNIREDLVGEAIQAEIFSGLITREDLFIQTK